jgi:hypothetical protein
VGAKFFKKERYQMNHRGHRPETSCPNLIVESTGYTFTLVPAGRSICRTIASPRVVREKCEFPPWATGNCRDPNGGTSSWMVSEQTGVSSAAGRSLYGTE